MNVDSSMCASSGKQARRLQASIVKATRVKTVATGFAHAGLSNGLSRMKGNFHVRFSGEGVAATPLPYPTGALDPPGLTP